MDTETKKPFEDWIGKYISLYSYDPVKGYTDSPRSSMILDSGTNEHGNYVSIGHEKYIYLDKDINKYVIGVKMIGASLASAEYGRFDITNTNPSIKPLVTPVENPWVVIRKFNTVNALPPSRERDTLVFGKIEFDCREGSFIGYKGTWGDDTLLPGIDVYTTFETAKEMVKFITRVYPDYVIDPKVLKSFGIEKDIKDEDEDYEDEDDDSTTIKVSDKISKMMDDLEKEFPAGKVYTKAEIDESLFSSGTVTIPGTVTVHSGTSIPDGTFSGTSIPDETFYFGKPIPKQAYIFLIWNMMFDFVEDQVEYISNIYFDKEVCESQAKDMETYYNTLHETKTGFRYELVEKDIIH